MASVTDFIDKMTFHTVPAALYTAGAGAVGYGIPVAARLLGGRFAVEVVAVAATSPTLLGLTFAVGALAYWAFNGIAAGAMKRYGADKLSEKQVHMVRCATSILWKTAMAVTGVSLGVFSAPFAFIPLGIAAGFSMNSCYKNIRD